MTKLTVNKNYVIYEEGDKPECLYFIKKGQVEVNYFFKCNYFVVKLKEKSYYK